MAGCQGRPSVVVCLENNVSVYKLFLVMLSLEGMINAGREINQVCHGK